MAADNITLPRAELFEAAAWLFAFDELFGATEEESPAVLQDLDRDDWQNVAHGLAYALAGDDLAELDDDAHNSHPVLVELFAQAREHAVAMLRLAESETHRGRYPLTDGGSPYTAKGFRLLARSLAADAKRARELGVIHPPIEVSDGR